jgi:hypothetical protein
MAINNRSVQDNLNRFNSVKDRARQLIQMDAKGEIDKVKKKAQNEGKIKVSQNTDGEFVGVDTTIMEKKSYGNMSQLPPINNSMNGLPQEIMESFKNKRINVGSDYPTNGGSILDELNVITATSPVSTPKHNINEQQQYYTTNTATGPITIPQQIDYSIIKVIVEDCIKKYTSALKKSILNESKNNSQNGSEIQAIKLGDKFSFVTDNGDLYEAKLEFKKNIRKK